MLETVGYILTDERGTNDNKIIKRIIEENDLNDDFKKT